MLKTAEKYIDGVLSGKINVSHTTRLTFERHKRDLLYAPEKGWYFDKKAVQKFFDFCTLIKHSPDKQKWVTFVPEPWQAAIIYIIFGWKKKNGYRRFNYSYIEIPKKNGKTTFAALFANYLLFFDSEKEAEIYCAASVEKQAKLCFGMAKKMIEHSPALKKRARILTKNVNIPTTYSKIEMLGRDSDTMEGINPHGAIIDEYHVWKNNDVLENIQTATVNRRQPLIIIITTAGRDKNLPCFRYRQLCLDVLNGKKTQDDTFAIIYTIDDDDDWKDPKVWQKANPNYGISVIPERFEEEFKGALNDNRKEASFKTKNLNIWIDAPQVWIKDEIWMKCNYGTDPELLRGQKCYAGLDLASHVDINALALFFPEIKGRPILKVFYWIPEEKAHERKDKVDYLSWTKKGLIKITPGNVIDIEKMVADIIQIARDYQIEGLAYDPAKAYHGVIQGLQKQGFPVDKMDEFAQGIMNMSAPTKEFERLILSGELDHLGDPVLRWMAGNMQIYTDINNNIKPDKKRSQDKIDGIVAAIMAIGEYMTLSSGKKEQKLIYKEHSLRFV